MKDHFLQVQRISLASKLYSYSEPLRASRPARGFNGPRLVGIKKIRDAMLLPDANYCNCSSMLFMRMRHDALRAKGIKEAHIHCSAFGPDLFAN
jgi:nitric oxide dioxygenase